MDLYLVLVSDCYYVMIVNCLTSHGRRTLMTTFRSGCADLPQVNTENA